MIYGDQWKLRIWHDTHTYIYIYFIYKWVCINIGGCSKSLKCSRDVILPYIAAGFFVWWMRNKLCMEHLGWGWLLSFLILLLWQKGKTDYAGVGSSSAILVCLALTTCDMQSCISTQSHENHEVDEAWASQTRKISPASQESCQQVYFYKLVWQKHLFWVTWNIGSGRSP